MSDLKRLLVPIVLAACVRTVLAGAGPDLAGSFVHESGSDRDAVAISVTVEAEADGKFSLSLMAAHRMPMGLRPTGAARDASITTGSCVLLTRIAFPIKGPARFGAPRRLTCFPSILTTLKILGALCFMGNIPLRARRGRIFQRSLIRRCDTGGSSGQKRLPTKWVRDRRKAQACRPDHD